MPAGATWKDLRVVLHYPGWEHLPWKIIASRCGFNFQISSSNSQLCEFFWSESSEVSEIPPGFHPWGTLTPRWWNPGHWRQRASNGEGWEALKRKIDSFVGDELMDVVFWLNMTWQFEVYRNVKYYEVLRCEFGIAKRKFESITGCRILD